MGLSSLIREDLHRARRLFVSGLSFCLHRLGDHPAMRDGQLGMRILDQARVVRRGYDNAANRGARLERSNHSIGRLTVEICGGLIEQ